jgi:hypothetical protein
VVGYRQDLGNLANDLVRIRRVSKQLAGMLHPFVICLCLSCARSGNGIGSSTNHSGSDERHNEESGSTVESLIMGFW